MRASELRGMINDAPAPAPPMSRQQAIDELSAWLAPTIKAQGVRPPRPDIVRWAHEQYYIPETSWPITLAPGQIVFARLFNDDSLGLSTYLYSTVKKSGKTAFAGVCAR